jgi:hypothetical protein
MARLTPLGDGEIRFSTIESMKKVLSFRIIKGWVTRWSLRGGMLHKLENIRGKATRPLHNEFFVRGPAIKKSKKRSV